MNLTDFDKFLDFNISEYENKLNANEAVNFSNTNVPISSFAKAVVRNTIFKLSSYLTVRHKFNKEAAVLFLSNSIDTRELVPLYNELQQQNIQCLFFTNKFHIYKKLAKDFSVLFIPLKINGEKSKKVKIQNNDLLAKAIVENNYYKNTHWLKKSYKIITKLKPSIIIGTNDLLPEQRILNTVSAKKNIPTVCQQHGAINKGGQFGHSNAKYWFVFGKHSKEMLVSYGLNGENIFITGTSFIEANIAKQKSNSFKDLPESNLAPDTRPFLVLFSGKGHLTSEENYKLQLKAVHELVTAQPKQYFIIKLHPKELAKAYQDFTMRNCKVLTHKEFTEKGYDLINLISIAKGIITGFSASVFEAITMDKIVFTVDCMHEYQIPELINNQLSVHTKSSGELQDNFSNYIQNPQSFDHIKNKALLFANKYFDIGEESAAKRKIKVIKQVIN